ncbi:DUF4157 domain-containing protein [Niveispirillum sp. KHB5.9]|uniref:eCIS core domain-containing protein n=1 Tax=Niveispirillum sp. KHB5.9 TaxID=3400269 RepID=UPI003A84BDF3
MSDFTQARQAASPTQAAGGDHQQGATRPAAAPVAQMARDLQRGERQEVLQAVKGRLNGAVAQRRGAGAMGLPPALKTGIESLSGLAMDDVRVHRNSPEPAQLQAHAFARGTDIHLAPGQEQHLPHEAWHVVQQKQGRVRATTQMKSGTPVNDDPALEHEADRMGAAALRVPAAGSVVQAIAHPAAAGIVQRVVLSRVLPLIGGGVRIEYYSTLDPEKEEFPTEAEAQARDDELRVAIREPAHDRRYPTGFTYRHHKSKSENIISDAKQGPHSFSHAGVANRVNNAFQAPGFDQDALRALRDEQIPTQEQINPLYERYGGDSKKPQEHADNRRVLRAQTDYDILYRRLNNIIEGNVISRNREDFELTMRLMEMHPFSAFGAKNTDPSNRSLNGKGERADVPLRESFDSKTPNTFKKDPGFGVFVNTRMLLDRYMKVVPPKITHAPSVDIGSDLDVPEVFGKKRKFESKPEQKEVSASLGMGDVEAGDAVTVDGRTYRPNTRGISDGGECFWDSLTRWGISQEDQRLAAEATGVTYNDWIDVTDLQAFIDNLNTRLEIPVTLHVVFFNHADLSQPDGEQDYGSGGRMIYMAMFFLGDRGHFVPPS